MAHVLVTDSIQEDGLLPLLNDDSIQCDIGSIQNYEEHLSKYEALLVRSATKVTSDLLDKMPNLKIVARAGVGIDNIDIEEATKRGVIVVNAPDGNTISTTEHTFAMMASLARNIPQGTNSLKNGKWMRKQYVGTELNRKTLGIIGLGRIGTELSRRARAFGMQVMVFDPFLTNDRADKLDVASVDIDELLEQSDFITVHTPLTENTRGLINGETLAKTKKGVFLINCARGGIIDEDSLIPYLDSGHIGGVALDVFESEPPREDHPLLKYDQVIVTPHLGASTKEAQLNVAAQVADEVQLYLSGKPIRNTINLPAFSNEEYEKIKPYYELTRKMGSILSQCMKTAVNVVDVTYAGTLTELDTAILTRSLMASFLRYRLDTTVNEVNAPSIAKERGITYGEKHTSETHGYSNLISVTVEGDKGSFSLQGTYIKEYCERITQLNGFDIDFHPQGHLLYIQHNDRPGVIGNVGKVLGEHEVNIATMQVGRKVAGGEAIMMLSFDEALPAHIESTISSVQDIVKVEQIKGV
ncbi:phosphoglycerate dehydrogenase [Alkalihalobacillus sp. CinArs1]|uniref:phosphoglycerate dehydrogenase n=1 Tax=Alkalihalobacillus sp. CinArs1 TaxID=2995314 RepID=UPI0022DD97F7|nr:phosphoglycerate dehydrogenase [Alkalihalobacillus sp. CinArs1]